MKTTKNKCLIDKGNLRKLMIGARIRVSRLCMGMEQTDFAQRLGTQAANISRWEKGITEPKQETICKIAELTEFDWQWFYKE